MVSSSFLVKIDEMFCLVCDVTAKVSANNAVPSWIILLVKLLNILFNVVLLHCLSCTVYCILLHVFRHVSIFDYGLPVRHGQCWCLLSLSKDRERENIRP
uniref:Uncharacterized protein n=1 Tax=Callorhinchus milii TaxID=7868 RepID=A0A4W3IBI8_CALMI